MIAYKLGTSSQTLVFSNGVLEHFETHKQSNFWRREAGGHLFAKVEDDMLTVKLASGPEKGDIRSRFAFGFNRQSSQQIINAQFAANMHYIGDWHTHPQDYPMPSSIDHRTMKTRFEKSDHGLKSMVFCIIGRAEFPRGLAVLMQNERDCLRLSSEEK